MTSSMPPSDSPCQRARRAVGGRKFDDNEGCRQPAGHRPRRRVPVPPPAPVTQPRPGDSRCGDCSRDRLRRRRPDHRWTNRTSAQDPLGPRVGLVYSVGILPSVTVATPITGPEDPSVRALASLTRCSASGWSRRVASRRGSRRRHQHHVLSALIAPLMWIARTLDDRLTGSVDVNAAWIDVGVVGELALLDHGDQLPVMAVFAGA